MSRNSYLSRRIAGRDIRRMFLVYGAFVSGIGLVLPLLEVLPIVGSFPSPSLVAYLPAIVIGLPYWLFSGRYRNSIAIWLILGVLAVGLMWTDSPISGAITLGMVLSMIAISAVITEEKDWRVASRCFLIGLILGLLILFYILLVSTPFVTQIGNRLGWLRDLDGLVISDPNIVGFHAGFGVLVALSVLTNNTRRNVSSFDRRLAAFAGVLAFLAVVFTLSLGAVASMLGALFVVLVFGAVIRKWQTWAVLGAAGIAVFVLVALVAPAFLDRISVERVSSASGRLPIWTGALDFVTRDVPTLLFGAGSGSGSSALAQHNPRLLSLIGGDGPPEVDSAGDKLSIGVHSTYVSWVLSYGLWGILIAGIALLLVIIRARSLDDRKPIAVGLGMVAFFLLISVSQTAYAMAVSVSIGCGGMSLGYLYYSRN